MRRIVTLLLLAADVYLGIQIYRGFMADMSPYGQFLQEMKNESAGDETPYVSSGSTATPQPDGPHYISGSTNPTGQITLGGNTSEDKLEKYGTEDASIIAEYRKFDWYRDGVLINGLPSGTRKITDPSEIFGTYDLYVLFDPSNMSGSTGDLFGIARIDAGQAGTTVHIDWTYTYYHKDGRGETDHSKSDFTGSMDNGSVAASGPGKINIETFFYQDGVIRAVGTMETTSGILAYIALEKQ